MLLHVHVSTEERVIAPRLVESLNLPTCSNGIPSCAHPWLLTSLVREYWGRPDATHVSDCGAIEDEYTAKGCKSVAHLP